MADDAHEKPVLRVIQGEHRDRFALEVAHRFHAAATHDDIGAVGDVHDEDDPRLQTIHGEPEQLVEAYHHAVDRLVAKCAQDFARRRVLDELDGGGVQPAELPREIQRLAAYPDIGADAQRSLGLTRTAEERQQEHPAGDDIKTRSGARGGFHVTLHPARKCSPHCARS